MTVVFASPENIVRAAALLRAGKLVAFPTETVYGLGGDAANDRAVASIFEAKGRPRFNPLIAHVAAPGALDGLIVWNDQARKLVAKFWPGPLTLVLPRAKDCPVSLLASAGLETLAVRMPSHPVALNLLSEFKGPIAAPSANTFGRLSPTEAKHVEDSIGHKADLILDGGRCEVGVESTVLDLTRSQPVILRHGGVTREMLEPVIGAMGEQTHDDQAPKAPGMLASHYAPRLPLKMNALEAGDTEALLCFGSRLPDKRGRKWLNLSPQGDLTEAAANLFGMLRELDQPLFSSIAVMSVPDTGLGAAINDRLRRAAVSRK